MIKTKHGLLGTLFRAKTGISRLYNEIKGDDTFHNRLIDDVTNAEHDGFTLEQIAEQYNLTDEFKDYVDNNIAKGIKGYLSKAYYWTSVVKDTLEDVLEGAELVIAAATAGTGLVPVEGTKIPIGLLTQGIYNVLATVFGYGSGTYTMGIKGGAKYFSDLGKSNLGAIVNLVPAIGSMIELTTNIGDPEESIKEAASDRARYWLIQKVKQRNPEATLSDFTREHDLVDRVKTLHGKITRNKEPFVDYSHAAPDFYMGSSYDLSGISGAYQTVSS